MNLKLFQEHIERIGTKLDPDDDWMPVLLLEKDDQSAVVGLLLMENDEMKDICAMVMTQLVRVTNPDSVCFVSTAWLSRPPEDVRKKYKSEEEVYKAYGSGEIVRPSEDPNREEIVIAICIGVKGENDGEAMMMGKIERSPNQPPRIIKWEIHDDEYELKGRFANALKNGFDEVDADGDLSRLSKMKGLIDEARDTT